MYCNYKLDLLKIETKLNYEAFSEDIQWSKGSMHYCVLFTREYFKYCGLLLLPHNTFLCTSKYSYKLNCLSTV